MLRSSATSYFRADGLGSITSLSSSAGSIANTYTYDSFGNLAASTGSLVNPFRYTARESDTETGLYYYRARYYDPNAGRFVSEDPTQFDGGTDFYAYVQNSPNILADPFGLAQCVYSISQHTLSCVSNVAPPVGPRRSSRVGPNNVSSGDGQCKDNPKCTGTDHEGHGPIPPGEYRMNTDPRKGNEGQFRLEPQPTVSGWRVWIPGWMPGAARGGFRLHLGSRTHGCINALWDDPNTRAQYQNMLDLLKSEDGNNWLLVTP